MIEAIQTAHSGEPDPESWGIIGSFSDRTVTGHLRRFHCWLPTQAELAYFVAFCNANPEIYNRSQNQAPEVIRQEDVERKLVDIREVLAVVASTSGSYIERVRQINRIHVCLAEWCGSFDELAFSHSAYALFLRRYARHHWSRFTAKKTPGTSSPITPNELRLFRKLCGEWHGVNGLWGLPRDLSEMRDELIQVSLFL